MTTFQLDQCLDSKRFARDCALPHEHTASIPALHPGIIVISNYPAPQTMTVRIAQRILARFKAALPEWHSVAWTNSVVEVTSIGVEVWHIDGPRLVQDTYSAFDSADWQNRLMSALQCNSRLHSPGLTEPTA